MVVCGRRRVLNLTKRDKFRGSPDVSHPRARARRPPPLFGPRPGNRIRAIALLESGLRGEPPALRRCPIPDSWNASSPTPASQE